MADANRTYKDTIELELDVFMVLEVEIEYDAIRSEARTRDYEGNDSAAEFVSVRVISVESEGTEAIRNSKANAVFDVLDLVAKAYVEKRWKSYEERILEELSETAESARYERSEAGRIARMEYQPLQG